MYVYGMDPGGGDGGVMYNYYQTLKQVLNDLLTAFKGTTFLNTLTSLNELTKRLN